MLFDPNIEPSCSYCRYGSHMGNDEFVCSKRGIMSGVGSCGSFCYEPTKRQPEARQILRDSGFTEEDFSISGES